MYRHYFSKPRLIFLLTALAIFLLLFFLGSWLTEASGASVSELEKIGCEKPGRLMILLDATVADKLALKKELLGVVDELLVDSHSSGESLFGYQVSLGLLNEDGENSPDWTFRFPVHFGQRRAEWNASLEELGFNLKKTIDKLDVDTKEHPSSFLIEGVSKYLRQLGPCDRLEIISDLYVVDRSGNNFERLTFNEPKFVKSKAKIRVHRIAVKGRSQRSIQLVEAWWDDFLFGTNRFEAEAQSGAPKKLIVEKNKNSSHQSERTKTFLGGKKAAPRSKPEIEADSGHYQKIMRRHL